MIALLDGHSTKVKAWFQAEKFALNLSERQSTANITIGPEAPVIGVNDWLRDEEEPGAGIIWRVKTIETDYATDTRTLNCEHLIAALRDLVMFGEVKPGDMAGNKKATNCTAEQAVKYILKQQKDWTLGGIGYTKSAPYNFNGDDLLSALETVSSSLMDAWWSYDFSVYPFKLYIRPKNTQVACEMRMDRNIRTLKKTIDRSRMYTRFYPIGKNNLKLGGGGYVSKNEGLYGVVCKVETDQDKDTAEKLKAWANEKLNNHAEPSVTVTISGMDLSDATGESLDRLTLGTVCRVPLPEFSTTITEIISRLSWSDKLADPESVSITLANQVEDVANIINNLVKSGGGGGRAAAKAAEEDHAWFVDTTEKVGMVAEAVAGPGADQDWSRVSEIYADGTGLHAHVTRTEKDLVVAQSRIDVNENSITAEVKRATKAEGNLKASIKVNADNIELKVSKNNIISSINQTAESVTINASKINLSGYVTTSQLQSTQADIDNLKTGVTRASYLKTVQFSITDNYFTLNGNNAKWKTATIDGVTINYLGRD